MSLNTYKKKRNFASTPEPEGKSSARKGKLEFVVQRHRASRLHYDFRLEMGGVMKSWAIPKGPSLNPEDKRLAVMVEDHPYDYRTFEGTIPTGNYGAGTVEIWDKGTYAATDGANASEEKTLLKGLKAGSLKFRMDGHYLQGEFALVRMKNAKEDNAWLLIKHRDEFAVDEPYSSEDHTSITALKHKPGKDTAQQKTPNSRRNTSTRPATDSTQAVAPIRSSKKHHLKSYIKPMLASPGDEPFDSADWLFEIKWDGYRAIAEVGGELRLYSRNGLSFLDQFPDVTNALKIIRAHMVLDGEIVALDEAGRSGFQLLQDFDPSESVLAYYVFDILKKGSRDTTGLPLLKRKALLAKALPVSDVIRYSDHVLEEGRNFFAGARRLNLEGIIAKRTDSTYDSGKRTGNWLKIKNLTGQEAVIVGFTEPRGSRRYFGSLILAVHANGKLVYAGHAGTGFNASSLKALHEALEPLITPHCPLETTPNTNAPATWVKPQLVCEVKYSEVTDDGVMRHPVFKGLRIDKEPGEVVNEQLDITHKASAAMNKRTSRHKVKRKDANETPAGTAADNSEARIRLNGHSVTLTNQRKVYFPDDHITKGDIIQYYQEISGYLLPYLKNRPESLYRTPDGILDDGFFHKDAGDTAPEWVKTKSIYSGSADKNIDYIICNDKATLAYLNNLGCIEMNPWHSKLSTLDKPDYFAIDIDPSSSNTFDEVIETALAVKEVFDRAGADCFCKTSGATGLHVYAPLAARYDYEAVKKFAEIIALLSHELVPEFTSLVRPLKQRGKKIYLDFLQNRRGQTLASVYSVRPVAGATVSTPLEWNEVKKGLHPSKFTVKTIGARLKRKGDLFEGVLGKGLDMEKCLTRLRKQ